MTKLRLFTLWLFVTSLILCSSLLVTRNRVIVCGETADCIFADGTIIKQKGFPLTMYENCVTGIYINGGVASSGNDYCRDNLPDRKTSIVWNFVIYGTVTAVGFVLSRSVWHNKSKRKH